MSKKSLSKQVLFEKYVNKLTKAHPDVIMKAANQFENKTIGATYITGIPPFDILIGGGIGMGGVVEISGPENSGKTTLLLTILERLMLIHPDKTFMYIDAERNLTQIVMERFPLIDWDKVIVLEPESMEQMFEIVEEAKEFIDFIILDSVAALRTEILKDKDMTKAEMAASARQFGKGWKNAYYWASYGITSIFINQLRDTLNQWAPTTTTGGNALKFLKNYALEMARSGGKGGGIGLEKLEIANAFGKDKNETKKIESAFADEVTIKYLKSKNEGVHKDQRIMYLKNRSFTAHENYEIYSNKPGGFLESISNFAMAFSMPFIERAQNGRITLLHPFTLEKIKGFASRKNFTKEVEANPDLYFIMMVGVYYYGLNRNGMSTNKMFFNTYETILKACQAATKIKYEYYKDDSFYNAETSEKINTYAEKFIKDFPLSKILKEEEYNKYVNSYGDQPWKALNYGSEIKEAS